MTLSDSFTYASAVLKMSLQRLQRSARRVILIAKPTRLEWLIFDNDSCRPTEVNRRGGD